jgi:hypothetical protein
MGYGCWNAYSNTMQIFETCQHQRLVPSCCHKTKHIVHQSNNNMLANGRPTAFQFDTFLTALQNTIGQGGKPDVRLAKRFVWEKLSKKVQFLQPNNDDMMEKVYTMAWKYMNYNADDFSSVWTKVVLPTIKSEMNLLRSGYAAAIKNQIILGKVILIVGCITACN